MKKIIFNQETIDKIRNYIEQGHTIEETSNRFTIKHDTLRRIMWENNIQPFHKNKSNGKQITEEIKNQIVTLYETTMISKRDLCKQFKLQDYILQSVLDEFFSKEYQDKRKSKMYSLSKLGDKNPMTGKVGDLHHGYKGIIDDGNGYSMCLKPDWYTGRTNSSYVFYHHIVFCQSIGITEIPKGFVIHHIDLNKKNNDISNLCMMSISAHGRIHAQINNLSKVQRLSTME